MAAPAANAGALAYTTNPWLGIVDAADDLRTWLERAVAFGFPLRRATFRRHLAKVDVGLELAHGLVNVTAEVQEVDFPQLKYVLPTYYILTTAEASANLSRFDGVKYGYRTPEAQNLEQLYKNSRSEGFGEEVKRRIMLGTFVLSASYYDAYFTKAQKVRRIIRDLTANLLTDFDYLLLPTTPTTAFKFGEHGGDPVAMYLEDLFTVQASVSGVPALSIPNGKDDSGMPIGLQVITNSFKEAELYAFGHYLSTLTLN